MPPKKKVKQKVAEAAPKAPAPPAVKVDPPSPPKPPSPPPADIPLPIPPPQPRTTEPPPAIPDPNRIHFARPSVEDVPEEPEQEYAGGGGDDYWDGDGHDQFAQDEWGGEPDTGGHGSEGGWDGGSGSGTRAHNSPMMGGNAGGEAAWSQLSTLGAAGVSGAGQTAGVGGWGNEVGDVHGDGGGGVAAAPVDNGGGMVGGWRDPPTTVQNSPAPPNLKKSLPFTGFTGFSSASQKAAPPTSGSPALAPIPPPAPPAPVTQQPPTNAHHSSLPQRIVHHLGPTHHHHSKHAWGQHTAQTRAPPSAPTPAAARSVSSIEAYSKSAWSQWASEAKMVPKVTTTITASVPDPLAPPAPPVSSFGAHPTAAFRGGNRTIPSHQQQSQLLQSLLSQPGQAKSTSIYPQAQPAQAGMRQNPSWGHQQAQSAQPSIHLQQQQQYGWGDGNIPQSDLHRRHQSQAHPQHPQQMQQQDSWGSSAWGTGGVDGGWGGSAADGAWGTNKADGGTSRAERGRGRKENKGWGADQVDGGWGSNKDDGGWGTNKDDGAWGASKGDGGLGSEWDTIHEEDEEEEDYDDGWGDEEEGEEEDDGGWGQQQHHSGEDQYGHRVRFSPGVSYKSMSLQDGHAPSGSYPPSSNYPASQQHQPLLPNPASSRTMNIAAGRMTTIFELTPPRNGMGEVTFIESHRAALKPAERALYSRERLAKDRIIWHFNPDKDERVASLIRWVQEMSNGLADIGLRKFLDGEQRGALITNADFRVNSAPGAPAQPAFDWITMEDVQPSLDRILQESVAYYHPSTQVVVLIFLLSKSGNSMAMWRRKISIPENLRKQHKDRMIQVLRQLEEQKKPIVYVDELPPKPQAKSAPVVEKPKRGFWRRLFCL